MISTGVMIRLGYVFGNLMVNVQPSNEKLLDRARRIVAAATQLDDARAAELLDQAGRQVSVAIVMAKRNVAREEAERRLAAGGGRLRAAIGEGGAEARR
jgi:N-acetylmuramic acid 6-phosphate etherase